MSAMRGLLAGIASCALALSLAACGGGGTGSGDAPGDATTEAASTEAAATEAATDAATDGSSSAENPWTECGSVSEAAEKAGFSMDGPEDVAGYSFSSVSVLDDDPKMIQIIYADANGSELTIRKAPASGDTTTDISGDYNYYSETGTVTQGDLTASTRGEGGNVCVMTWTNGGYDFSVSCSAGISTDVAQSLLQMVM
jgi:hypothetical protein